MTPLPSPIAQAAAAPPIIGRGITSALIGSSVLLGLLLIPDRDELQERFARDGNHHRALQLASDHEAQALAEKLRLAQLAAETVVVETPGQIVANTFANPARLATLNADPVARKNFVLALLATQDVEHDFELLKTHSAALSPEARDAILRGLGDSALSQSHPELAARVYSEFLKAHPDTDPSLVTEMVKSWRYSGQPAQALAFLENWLTARKAAGGTIPEELYLTQITLLREMNKPGQAFDALLLQLAREKARPAGISVETMKLSVQTAGFVDRTSELRPILAEWVNRMPLAQAPWDKVRDAKAGTPLLENKGAFLTYGHMLAQWHEWGDEADAAYDLYLKLAVLGEPGAIERCEALYPGLFREEEYLNLLLAVVPVAGAETYTLQLAQNLAGAARYDEAEKWFHTWLTAHPDDGHTFAELGGMREEQAELEAALAAYQRALELLPADLDIRKKTATVCIDLEKHEAALELYKKFTPAEHDSFTLENYALLAESLADYTHLNRALTMRMERLSTPKAMDYVDWGRSFNLVDDEDGEIQALQRGLKALPASRIIHMELASSLREADRGVEAIALLEKPWLKDDLQAASLYIECCVLEEAYDRAFAFLGGGLEQKFALSPDVRLDLGQIYFHTGQVARAEALFDSVSESPVTWPLLAQARFKRGDLDGAEAFQKKHLAHTPLPDPDGWMFLGDIYRTSGREREAQSAYDKALSLMKDKIQPPAPGDGATKVSALQLRPARSTKPQ